MRKMSESQAAAFRKSLYALAPALSAVLVVFGIWTNEQAAVVTGAVTPCVFQYGPEHVHRRGIDALFADRIKASKWGVNGD